MTSASFMLKLDRAREHLNAFEIEADSWLKSHPYALAHEPDSDTFMHPVLHGGIRRRLRIIGAAPIPSPFPLLVGDCVHNLRSSLDHLALALAMAHTVTMTEEQIQLSEFPIFYTKAMSPDTERRKIGCIAPPARALIKSLQPHHRLNDYRSDPLWQLYELDRVDKHRTLTVCALLSMAGGSKGVSFKIGPGWHNVLAMPFVDVVGGELKRDAVIARYTVLPTDPSREVKVKADITPAIAFGQGSAAPHQPVIPTLHSLCDFVGNTVIAQLAQFL